MATLPNPPSLVVNGPLSFLIFDAPSDSNIKLYVEVYILYFSINSTQLQLNSNSTPTQLNSTQLNSTQLNSTQLHTKQCKKHNVKNLVRVCESTYDPAPMEVEGIKVHV
jgi:hypothetical protein